MVAITASGLAFFGLSYVNLDNLWARPFPFIGLFVLPPLFGVLSLFLAALPRLAQIKSLGLSFPLDRSGARS
jgi:hypothetical protein